MPCVESALTKNVVSGTVGIGCTDSIIAGETCFILLRISSTMILGDSKDRKEFHFDIS